MSDGDEENGPEPGLTVGDLMAMLQTADLPNDAEVVIGVGGALAVPMDELPDEVRAVEVSALRGYREASKLIIHSA